MIYTSPSKEGAALAEETLPDGEEPATREVKEDSWQIFWGKHLGSTGRERLEGGREDKFSIYREDFDC